jgi:hypothetical protein
VLPENVRGETLSAVRADKTGVMTVGAAEIAASRESHATEVARIVEETRPDQAGKVQDSSSPAS